MSDMNIPVITIAREYYAGGRSIAQKLSEALSIPWYDNDFVKLTSQISGYSESEILEEGEELSKLEYALDTLLNSANFYTSSHDEIHAAQKDAVLELAKKPCIIVGRGANAILRDAGIESFDIFLYADKETRIQRTMERMNFSKEAAKKYLDKKDEFRRTYYNKYSGRVHADNHEYTVCIDTGVIDYDKCAEVLVSMIKSKYGI